jgi:Zn-dependent protease
MPMGEGLSSARELKDILIADVVLILAFSLTIVGGISGFQSNPSQAIGMFEYYLPIAAVGVTLSFILHEMMHKFFAQRYGAMAEFRTSWMGLAVTLVTGAFGFLLGIPGATVIYTSSFTKKENGIVSIAGPLTNFVVFAAFLAISLILNPPVSSYLHSVISFTIFISILLAFFNMLPIYPLDGSKVLTWSKPIYIIVMLAIFALMVLFTSIGLINILIMVGIALAFSLFYRSAYRSGF